ncbi:MAG: nucleoside deaminase [Erysipelothrix sp.]|nr:nucleoside deaminase [Erysipelothrix sp.]
MKKDDEYYMNIALEEAQKAFDKGEIPVGCLIVKDDKILSRAHNLKEALNLATAHAEILAIDAAAKELANWRLENTTMYVTLEPCPMCAGAIVHSRINRVVFGALDNRDGAVVSSKHIFENNHSHKVFVTSGVKEVEANKIINDFLINKRKR